jgi:chemotaxis methyl-accepting protein methylase
MELSSDDFNYFRTRIYALAGISLSPAKHDLVQARLRTRVLNLGLKDYHEYREYLESKKDSDLEWEKFINLLTTNKTEWFRESAHFDFITDEFLPHWMKRGKQHLKVWCAASSTGEEPYTLSLVLHEALENTSHTYSILASDIDTNVLNTAANGVYPAERLEQIPEKYHDGFVIGKQDISEWMKVRKEIKQPVSFIQFNLTKFPYHHKESFDLVLCRNVLIYFNQETIKSVVENIFYATNSDAMLIIAHSESLQNVKSSWKYLKPSLYYKGKIF